MMKKYALVLVTLVYIVLTGFRQAASPLNTSSWNLLASEINSNLSTIIDNTIYSTTTPEFNSSPEYINFIDASSSTSGKFIPMKIKILDGPDDDDFGTTLTSLRLTVVDLSNANQLAMIKTAVLTGSGGAIIATATKVDHELVFSGMSGPLVTAEDDHINGKNLHIRVSLDETQVIDKTKLIFKITSATADPSGSSFTTIDAGGAQTDSGLNDRNRINVTADRMSFITHPTNASVGIGMYPFPVVILTDLYDRIDLDINLGSMTLNSTGLPNSHSSSPIVNGQGIFNTIEHTAPGGPFTLTANYSGWTAISNPFYVNDTAVASYRTTGSGNWISNNASPAIWERYTGSTWLVSNSPSYDSSDAVFIGHGHTLNSLDSFNSNIDLTVLNEGIFNVNHAGTLRNLTIHNGGNVTINQNLAIKSAGALVVKDGGNLNINFKYENPITSIWAGTENFYPSSNLIIKNWNALEALLPNNTTISTNLYGTYTAVFGNIICDFEDALDANEAVYLLTSGVSINLAHGNLIFRSNKAPNSDIQISTDGPVKSGIGGDFHVEETYTENQKLIFNTLGILDFTIKGNMLLDTATTFISNGSTIDSAVTIEGDLEIKSTAILDFNAATATGSLAKLNLYGDLFVAEGGVLQNSNSNENGILNFAGMGNGLTNETTQTIDIASNSPNENKQVNFNIYNNAYVKIINQDFKLGRNSSLTVKAGGSFEFGFDGATALNVAISGTQSGSKFSSQQGSSLKITSPDGISTTNDIGNVRTVSSNKSFNQTATFHYIGKQNQQTGNGLSFGSTMKNVYVNLENDQLELRLTNAVGISDGGKLEIQRGIVIGERIEGSNSDFYGTNGQLIMTGGEYRISSITNNPLREYLPLLRKYSSYSLTGGTINLNGNNEIQILSGVPTYYNLAFSGTNDLALPPLSYNYKGISKAVAITNTVTLSDKAIVDVENKTFGGATTNLIMKDYSRYITAGSGTKPDARGIYSFGPHTTIEFNNNSGQEEIRIINPVPSYSNIVVSGSNVGTQSAGTGSNSFIQFQPNGSFTITETGTFKLKNSFGFSGANNTAISNTNSPNIILEKHSTIEYAGADQNITLFDPEYRNLSISGTGTKTLGNTSHILIAEHLNVNSSTLLIKTNETISVAESVNVDSSAQFNIENSGSLIQIDDTKINSGKISMIRKASIKHQDYVYWSSPISGYNVDNITPTNHIYKWDPIAINPKNTQGNWVKATNEIMEAGKGYIVRAPHHHPSPTSSEDLNFTTTFYNADNGLGVPHNGKISVVIQRGNNAQSEHHDDDNWNLIGNPYPSSISAMEFLIHNEAINGYIYLWKHGLPLNSTVSSFYQNFKLNYHQADYFIYNGLGNSNDPSSFTGHIAAGQGFMVNMVDGPEAASAVVIFKNDMRNKEYPNNQFFKTPHTRDVFEEKHRIWLDLISPTMATNRIMVGYIKGATMGKDRLFDANFSVAGSRDGLYTLINDESYIIQGRSLPFHDSDIISLGLKVTQSENYTIAIAAADGLFEKSNQTIYLKDHLLGVIHNLSTQPYSFNSEAGTFHDRFEIVFKNQILSSTDFYLDTQDLSIVELSNGHVQFSIGSNLRMKSVEILDVLGRSLYHLKCNSANEVYDLSTLSQAAYIAKVTLSNGQTIIKRSIKRY